MGTIKEDCLVGSSSDAFNFSRGGGVGGRMGRRMGWLGYNGGGEIGGRIRQGLLKHARLFGLARDAWSIANVW